MASTMIGHLERFRRFVDQQLESPETAGMTPEETLARWREHEATRQTIREGLDDVEAGRTRSLDEVLHELRACQSA